MLGTEKKSEVGEPPIEDRVVADFAIGRRRRLKTLPTSISQAEVHYTPSSRGDTMCCLDG